MILLELINSSRSTKDNSITYNIFRIQVNESIMCEVYRISFIEYILAEKSLLHDTNFFSLNDYKKEWQNNI